MTATDHTYIFTPLQYHHHTYTRLTACSELHPGGVTVARREGFHAWPSPHSFVSPYTPALILLTYLVILEQATYNTYI